MLLFIAHDGGKTREHACLTLLGTDEFSEDKASATEWKAEISSFFLATPSSGKDDRVL